MIENINIDLLRLSEHILLHRKGLRDYVTLDLCKNVVLNYKKYEVQENGRTKFWGIDETNRKFVRVVIDTDNITIVTAFYDRNFKG